MSLVLLVSCILFQNDSHTCSTNLMNTNIFNGHSLQLDFCGALRGHNILEAEMSPNNPN
jgi:hypothetical protein